MTRRTWAFARLAQVQEPGRACGEAGGGGGLGWRNGDKLPHAFRLPHRFMGCRWRERHRALGWCRGPSSRDGDLRGREPALAQGTNHLAPRLSSNRRQSPHSACVSAARTRRAFFFWKSRSNDQPREPWRICCPDLHRSPDCRDRVPGFASLVLVGRR